MNEISAKKDNKTKVAISTNEKAFKTKTCRELL